jgi:hypothetical protein
VLVNDKLTIPSFDREMLKNTNATLIGGSQNIPAQVKNVHAEVTETTRDVTLPSIEENAARVTTPTPPVFAAALPCSAKSRILSKASCSSPSGSEAGSLVQETLRGAACRYWTDRFAGDTGTANAGSGAGAGLRGCRTKLIGPRAFFSAGDTS